MNVILIAVISLGAIALVAAVILYVASKKFAVYEMCIRDSHLFIQRINGQPRYTRRLSSHLFSRPLSSAVSVL